MSVTPRQAADLAGIDDHEIVRIGPAVADHAIAAVGELCRGHLRFGRGESAIRLDAFVSREPKDILTDVAANVLVVAAIKDDRGNSQRAAKIIGSCRG